MPVRCNGSKINQTYSDFKCVPKFVRNNQLQNFINEGHYLLHRLYFHILFVIKDFSYVINILWVSAKIFVKNVQMDILQI